VGAVLREAGDWQQGGGYQGVGNVADKLLPQSLDRERGVQVAIGSLLPNEEKSRAFPFVSAFETTYYQVKGKKDDQPVPAATVEKQLVEMAHRCHGLFDHLQKMDQNAIGAWSQAALGRAGGVIAMWQLSQYVLESGDAAERAVPALREVRRPAKRGNPGDAMASAMTETAAFVYTKLTRKQISRGTKRGSFQTFLEDVFKAYGVEANSQHCIRELKKSEFWRKLEPEGAAERVVVAPSEDTRLSALTPGDAMATAMTETAALDAFLRKSEFWRKLDSRKSNTLQIKN
jgi:hypothetical protein